MTKLVVGLFLALSLSSGCALVKTHKVHDYQNHRTIYVNSLLPPMPNNRGVTQVQLSNGRNIILTDYRVFDDSDYQGPDKIVEGLR